MAGRPRPRRDEPGEPERRLRSFAQAGNAARSELAGQALVAARLTLILAAAALSACSAGSAATSSSSGGATASTAATAQLHVTVEVRGAVSGAAHFVQSAEARTCSAFASGINGNHTFSIPSGVSTAELSGSPFALEATIAPYRGPGEYATAAFGDPSTTTLTVDQSSSQTPFEPVAAGASESATINRDGSGSFAFNDWQDLSQRSESGSLMWACH